MTTGQKNYSEQQLETLIQRALQKVAGRKENDLCRYIPMNHGGYIHHFTMRKMKGESPSQLAQWIEQYILNCDRPERVQPKPRAARGSRRRKDQLYFSKGDIERLLHMARISGDKEMVRKLTPRKDLRGIKKELISSIKRGEVDQELWASYIEVASAHHHEPADEYSALAL